MKAPINKIIDFSTVDGPGLRSAIFFQKCNIRCLYCHNPETQNICSNCQRCVSVCKGNALKVVDGKVVYDKNKCINCDTCINICQNHASPKIEYLTPVDVFNRIKDNIPFIRGITVSGGECSLYPSFLKELFTLAKKEGLTTLMDSNGMVLYSEMKDLMDVTDGVMLDIKSWNDDTYNKLVGFSNKNVKENLIWLNANKKIEELRIVYIKDYVDAKNALVGIKGILKDNIKTTRIKLIAFRNNGVKSILKEHNNTTKEEMDELYNYAKSLGYLNIVVR